MEESRARQSARAFLPSFDNPVRDRRCLCDRERIDGSALEGTLAPRRCLYDELPERTLRRVAPMIISALSPTVNGPSAVRTAGNTSLCEPAKAAELVHPHVKVFNFNKLPAELRVMIYHLTMTHPRGICLRSSWSFEGGRIFGACHTALGGAVLLQLSMESRDFALCHYKLAFARLGSPVYVNFAYDQVTFHDTVALRFFGSS